MVIPGCWRNPEATAASFAGGYWKSGDIGRVDAQGHVRIADRKTDMIIRFVSTEGGELTPHHAQAWCTERLSDYKVPAHVIIDTAPLPRNANGKIQKAALRERAAALCGQFS